MFENRVLRKIFILYRDEVKGMGKTAYWKKLTFFYSLQVTISHHSVFSSHWRGRGAFFLSLQRVSVTTFLATWFLTLYIPPWEQKHHVPPKLWYSPTIAYGVTTQRYAISPITAVKTSNVIQGDICFLHYNKRRCNIWKMGFNWKSI